MSCPRYSLSVFAHPDVQFLVSCKAHDMVCGDVRVSGREEEPCLTVCDHRRCAAHIRCDDRQREHLRLRHTVRAVLDIRRVTIECGAKKSVAQFLCRCHSTQLDVDILMVDARKVLRK